jgi:hypothetical protein
LRLVDDRPNHRIGLIGVAYLQSAYPVRKLLHKRIINGIVDDKAVYAHADLALMQELAKYRRFDRPFQVCILQYHKRAVTAQLQFHPLQNWSFRC